MNRIRKAILAFAIFGFFGGCEVDALNDIRVQLLNQNRAVQMTVNNVTENDGQTYANYILVAGKTFKVATTYKELVTKILNGITLADRTENALCKEIVKKFLLSSADDLASKFGLYEDEIKSIMNIRSVFYLHISKHFFATEGRHSTGSTHSVCTISEEKLGNLNVSDYVSFMPENDELDIQDEKILSEVLTHIINSVDVQFCFSNGQIKADIPVANLPAFRANLAGTLLDGCNLEKYQVLNNKISNKPEPKSQCLPWQITNVEFFFKLMDVVRFDSVAQLLRSAVDNAREGSYGSCYFTLDTH